MKKFKIECYDGNNNQVVKLVLKSNLSKTEIQDSIVKNESQVFQLTTYDFFSGTHHIESACRTPSQTASF